MKRHEIHFVVGRSGEIQTTVKNMPGPGCRLIADRLADLGCIVDSAPTGEHFMNGEVRPVVTLRTESD